MAVRVELTGKWAELCSNARESCDSSRLYYTIPGPAVPTGLRNPMSPTRNCSSFLVSETDRGSRLQTALHIGGRLVAFACSIRKSAYGT